MLDAMHLAGAAVAWRSIATMCSRNHDDTLFLVFSCFFFGLLEDFKQCPFLLEVQAGANAQQLCAEASVRRKAGTTESRKAI